MSAMYELELKLESSVEVALPKWLVFVDKCDDDGPWLRMMINNPLNGAICPFIDTPIEVDSPCDPQGALCPARDVPPPA